MNESFDIENYLNSFFDLNVSPARVILKRGVFSELNDLLMTVGDRFAVVTTPSLYEKFLACAAPSSFDKIFRVFHVTGNCCSHEACDEVYSAMEKDGAFDAIVGIGGGTVTDVSKLVAYNARKQLVAIPTSSATCAAFTALAVVYHQNGIFKEYEYLSKNPDMCVISPELMMGAGSRLTAAGFSDAMAKYVEGVWSYSGKARDFYSDLGLNIAFSIYNEIISNGPRVLEDVDSGRLTPEAVEAFSYNIIAAGLSSGISGMKIYPNIAHSVSNGITAAFNGDRYLAIYHGEAISFGMAVGSLLMEGDIEKTGKFCSSLKKLRLPVSFSEILAMGGEGRSVEDGRKAELARIIVKKAMDSHESIHDISRITEDLLFKAILETDKIG